jgi:hypothetical protein
VVVDAIARISVKCEKAKAAIDCMPDEPPKKRRLKYDGLDDRLAYYDVWVRRASRLVIAQ